MSWDPIWANATETAEALGIDNYALLLLQRDRIFPTDCSACGRVRWRRRDIEARRAELRAYLQEHYPTVQLRQLDPT